MTVRRFEECAYSFVTPLPLAVCYDPIRSRSVADRCGPTRHSIHSLTSSLADCARELKEETRNKKEGYKSIRNKQHHGEYEECSHSRLCVCCMCRFSSGSILFVCFGVRLLLRRNRHHLTIHHTTTTVHHKRTSNTQQADRTSEQEIEDDSGSPATPATMSISLSNPISQVRKAYTQIDASPSMGSVWLLFLLLF